MLKPGSCDPDPRLFFTVFPKNPERGCLGCCVVSPKECREVQPRAGSPGEGAGHLQPFPGCRPGLLLPLAAAQQGPRASGVKLGVGGASPPAADNKNFLFLKQHFTVRQALGKLAESSQWWRSGSLFYRRWLGVSGGGRQDTWFRGLSQVSEVGTPLRPGCPGPSL